MSCIEPPDQREGNLGTEALGRDRVHGYATALQDALGPGGRHKMQCLQQQHSCKELGFLPLEGKKNDPRCLGFIHCCIKELKKSKQSSEPRRFFYRTGADTVPTNLPSRYKTLCALVS